MVHFIHEGFPLYVSFVTWVMFLGEGYEDVFLYVFLVLNCLVLMFVFRIINECGGEAVLMSSFSYHSITDKWPVIPSWNRAAPLNRKACGQHNQTLPDTIWLTVTHTRH